MWIAWDLRVRGNFCKLREQLSRRCLRFSWVGGLAHQGRPSSGSATAEGLIVASLRGSKPRSPAAHSSTALSLLLQQVHTNVMLLETSGVCFYDYRA